MADLLDVFLWFWLAVCGAVYALGSAYERRLRGQQRPGAADERPVRPPAPWSPQRDQQPHQPYQQQYQPHQPSQQHYQQHYQPSNQSTNQPNKQQQQQLEAQLPVATAVELTSAHSGAHSSGPASLPTASGYNELAVEWVNQLLYVLYANGRKYGALLGESVCRSLNEKLAHLVSSASGAPGELSVEFTALSLHRSAPLELANVRTDSESGKSVSIVCKLYEPRLVFELTVCRRGQLMAGQLASQATLERHYELHLESLEGKLRGVAVLADKLLVLQFVERPDTRATLQPLAGGSAGAPASAAAAAAPMEEDALVQLLLSAITQVVVDVDLAGEPDFPLCKLSSEAGGRPGANGPQAAPSAGSSKPLSSRLGELRRQIKHDFLGALTTSTSTHHQHPTPVGGSQPPEQRDRKLLVKLIQANNINYNQNVTALLELDAPGQLQASSSRQGSSPLWDELFLFTGSDESRELRVELWDSSAGASGARRQLAQSQRDQLLAGAPDAKFLGLARASVDEARREQVQRLTVPLEGRHQADQVGGELELELLYLEHASQSPQVASAGHQATPSWSSSGSLATSGGGGGGCGSSQASELVSVERKLTPAGYTITTTTVAKPAASGSTRKRPLPAAEAPPLRGRRAESLGRPGSAASASSAPNSPTGERAAPSSDARSLGARSRSRSRSILRALAKRLSFSRGRATRSQSLAASSEAVGDSRPPSRLELAGSRSRASSEHSNGGGGGGVVVDDDHLSSSLAAGRARSVPAPDVPRIVINRSATSGGPKRATSQLVLECAESVLSDSGATKLATRYYAVDTAAELNRQAGSRWRPRRRAGSSAGSAPLKLHVSNEHQFVACHLASSRSCHLCGRRFSRRPGKQGYRCRQCDLLAHKRCHAHVEHRCPRAPPQGLRLEYIDAEPGAPLAGSRAPPIRKSASVDADDRCAG